MRETRYCIVLLWRTGVGPVFSDIDVARAAADRPRTAVGEEGALV